MSFWEPIKDESVIRHVRKSGLVQKCIDLAKNGNISTEVHSFNTHYQADYSLLGLQIKHDDGSNYQGAGGVIVRYGEKIVFSVDCNFTAKEEILVYAESPPFNVKRAYTVHEYEKGEWENMIKKANSKKAKKNKNQV